MGSRNRIIAIIPARGGSKGVPKKNIRILAGKPLLSWTIEAAAASTAVDNIYVSTDCQSIADVATAWGGKVIMRPKELAEDWSPSEDALLHSLGSMEDAETIEAVVFLQATSPLRKAMHIDQAVALFRETQADSVFSAHPSHALIWSFQGDLPVPVTYDFHNRPMRQTMPKQFQENGALYVIKPEILLKSRNRLGGKIVLYEMNQEDSLDIDTEIDLLLAEIMLKKRLEKDSDH